MGFTKIKEIFKNILKTKSNFISILIFVTLGVGIFEGFDYTASGIEVSMNKAFKDQNAYDIFVPYALGCSKDELHEFEENEHISCAEGYFKAYEYIERNNEKYACCINSLTDNINQVSIIEGRLPKADNEIVLVRSGISKLDFNINDKISFIEGNGYSNYLISQLRDIGERQDVLDFKNDVTTNFVNNEFTIVGFVRHPEYFNRGISCYGTFPDSAIQIETIGFVNYSAFNPRITNNYYNNVILRVSDAEKVNVIKKDYETILNNVSEEIRPIANKIAKTRYDTCKNNIDELLSYEDLVDVIANILHKFKLISDEIYANYSALKNKIKDYSEELSKADHTEVVPLTNNACFYIGFLPINVIKKVKYSLGGLFLFIALLISFSSINRMVSDELKIIGTKKALGFKKREVCFAYMGYTLIATIIGLILANILALVIEYFLIPLAGSGLIIPYVRNFASPSLILIMSSGVLVFIELMAFLACSAAVRKKAVDLLKGDISSSHGKIRWYEKTKLWKKLPLVNRTMINNVVSDKRRVLGTIIGITSCTCMMIGSIMMDRNVVEAFDLEMKSNSKYNYFIYFDQNVENSLTNIMSYLDEEKIDAAPVYREASFINVGEEKVYAYTMVYFDNSKFDSLIKVNSSSGNEFNHKGLWLPESIKEEYGIKANSSIQFTTLKGDNGEFEIEGYYKCYSYFISAYMTKADYEEAYGITPKENIILVNTKNADINKIKEDLRKIDGYKGVFDYEGFLLETVDAFTLVANAVVGMFMAICVLMGFFVILNLLISFVTEKKRDLITLMINGYSFKQTCSYIYSDTIFLTVISLILGTLLGILMGSLIINSFESGYIHMPHTPNLAAILVGCGVTTILVLLMTVIALKRVKKYKLSDINSSTM